MYDIQYRYIYISEKFHRLTCPNNIILSLPAELPFSFYCVTQGIAAAAKDYQSAVRNTILGGGDVGCRSSFIGACVAARGGLDSIPMEWILKLKRTEEILGYIETVIKC